MQGINFIIDIHILIKNPKQVTMIIEFTPFSDKLRKIGILASQTLNLFFPTIFSKVKYFYEFMCLVGEK